MNHLKSELKRQKELLTRMSKDGNEKMVSFYQKNIDKLESMIKLQEKRIKKTKK